VLALAIAASGSPARAAPALLPAGHVYAWGYNYYGQLGEGSTTTSVPFGKPTPKDISVLAGSPLAGVTVTAIAAGDQHSLALDSNGHVYAWGLNYTGQLGEGSTTTSVPFGKPIPKDISVLAGSPLAGVTVTAIAAGYRHSLALGNNGHVYAWGINSSGELGDGTTITTGCACKPTPEDISKPDGSPLHNVRVVAIAAGMHYSLALDGNGDVYAWGDNSSGELGDGTTITTGCWCKPTPEEITAVHGSSLLGVKIIAIATDADAFHTLALANNGQVYTWGSNYSGEEGDGTFSNTPNTCQCKATPEDISMMAGSPLAGVTAIAAGGGQSLALGSKGQVYAWGNDIDGVLGDGSTPTNPCECQASPEDISTAAGSALAGATVKALAAGLGYNLALGNTGHVYAWGLNNRGQLGDGTVTTSGFQLKPIPEDISAVPGSPLADVRVTALAAGGGQSLALGMW
jgi:alpha-tubulin suppressor-like RCC1 family protein